MKVSDIFAISTKQHQCNITLKSVALREMLNIELLTDLLGDEEHSTKGAKDI